MAGRNKIGSLLVALLAFFALSGAAIALFGEYEDEQPVERTYVPAPAAVRGETPEQAHARSAGCLSCHTASDEPTMHRSDAVVLGCTDCHGGDATVLAPEHLTKTDPLYAQFRDRAHVLPRFPKAWNFPSAAKPMESYTLLNREAPQFIRFVNPSDYRVVRESCGACHLEVIQAAERSLMTTGAMFLEGASYNNGILPFKNGVLGEADT